MHSIIVTTLIRSEHYRMEQERNHPDFEAIPLLTIHRGPGGMWDKLMGFLVRDERGTRSQLPQEVVVAESP